VTTPRAGTVERATRAELRRLRVSVATEGLAALAVALAKQIDNSRGAVAAAAAAAQLRLILADLGKLAADRSPEADPIDALAADELASRRDRRPDAAAAG
jgi:hypothetical protein